MKSNPALVKIFVSAILAACIPQNAGSQTAAQAGLRMFQQMQSDDLKPMKALIHSVLSNEERATAEAITILMPLDDSIRTPVAFTEDGKRKIEMPVGFYRYILAMGDITAIQMGTGKGGIADFMNYALRVMKVNAGKSIDSREKILWPGEYYGISIEEMEGLVSHPEFGMTRTGIITGSLAFIYAHELAHHILGHTMTVPADLAESRKRERDADEWASKTLAKAGIIPIGGLYALSVYYLMDQDALLTESKRTHPAEMRRFELIGAQTLRSLPLFRERFESQGVDYESTRKGIEASLAFIQEEIRKVDGKR